MSAIADAMVKTALIGMSSRLPAFNAAYCYELQWMFEEDNRPAPNKETFTTVQAALDAMVVVWNTPKTLVHISLSRLNA